MLTGVRLVGVSLNILSPIRLLLQSPFFEEMEYRLTFHNMLQLCIAISTFANEKAIEKKTQIS